MPGKKTMAQVPVLRSLPREEPKAPSTKPESYQPRPLKALDDPEASLSWPIPYETEVALTALRTYPAAEAPEGRRLLAALAENAAMREELDATTRELAEAFQQIQRLTTRPYYAATGNEILLVASICNGTLIRDLAHALQALAYDMRGRRYELDKYKAKVKAIITVEPDKEEDAVMRLGVEVSQDAPAAASAGKLVMDTDGEIQVDGDTAQHLPLFKDAA